MGPATLKSDAFRHLQVIRDFAAHLSSQLAGGTGSVTDMAVAYGIERTLAWKMLRMAAAEDPLAIAHFLPGDRAMGRVFDAAKKREINAEEVARAKQALQTFRQLASIHTEGEASLDLMVSGQASSGREVVDREQRRAAYRANSYLLGASATTLYDATFCTPSATGKDIDIATIRGYMGLSTLREGVQWPIARRVAMATLDGAVQLQGEPLVPHDVAQGVPLLRHYSTPDLGSLTEAESPDGHVRYCVEPKGVGKQAAVNVLIGESYRQASTRFATENEPNHALGVMIRTPSQRAVIEQFVHKDLGLGQTPQLFALSMMFGQPSMAEIQHARGMLVPLYESVTTIEDASHAVAPKGIADHKHLCELATHRLSASLDAFTLHRVVLEFPPHPVMLVMRTPFAKQQ